MEQFTQLLFGLSWEWTKEPKKIVPRISLRNTYLAWAAAAPGAPALAAAGLG